MNGMVAPIYVVRRKSGHNKAMHRSREAGRIHMDNHSSPPGYAGRYPLGMIANGSVGGTVLFRG
jgi:hypothetical protein